MKVALKIQRYDPVAGRRKLVDYEVDAPDWVTLLDVLDLVKDKVDGTLAYRKSCRMMICGSCGMRMDGAAVLACKTRMYDIVQAGHVPVISPMGNLPVVKDLVVDMEPFWGKIRAVTPYLDPGYTDPGEKEHVVSQKEMDVIKKEALCIMCGCCVSECNSMEADPDFLGPAALAKGMRFVGDARDQAKVERLQSYSEEHGIWDCTRCYFCNERCPKGVDPRDAIAKLGAEAIKEGIDSDMGAKHAKWFVTSAKTTGWLRETELVPKTQGVARALKEVKFAMGLAKHGKVPPPVPPHVAKHVDEARALYDLVKHEGEPGAKGIVQVEHALERLEFEAAEERDPYGEGSFPPPKPIPGQEEEPTGVRTVAYYKGCLAALSAKELDISTQALAPKVGLELIELESVTCCGAGDIHEAEPDYYLHLNARILAYAEDTGSDTLMTVCNVCTLNLRQANHALKGDAALLERVNGNLAEGGGACVLRERRRAALSLARRGGRGLRAPEDRGAEGPAGTQDRALLRVSDPAPVEAPRLRGPGQADVARADHRGLRGRADRLPGEDQVLRVPDHPGARGRRTRRAHPADRAGEGGGRRRDGDSVPALPPLTRRVAAEAEGADGKGLPDAGAPPLTAHRRRGRPRRLRPRVQAPHCLRRACDQQAGSLSEPATQPRPDG